MVTIDVTLATATTPASYRVHGYNKTELHQRVEEELKGLRAASYPTVCRWLVELNLGEIPLGGYTEDHVKILETYGKYLLVHPAVRAKQATLKELSDETHSGSDEPKS
jgi:hypothetical protein